jgi:hypothetical protein
MIELVKDSKDDSSIQIADLFVKDQESYQLPAQ